MGWSGNHNRAQYVAEVRRGWSNAERAVTVRKHHKEGQEDWFILDVVNADGTTEAAITMLLWDGGMVKSMDETSGPFYHGCPVSWLDEVPEPDSEFAHDWRMRVRGTPVNRCENCRKLDCPGHAEQLIVVCAWGSWADNVPAGMVGVGACYGGRVRGMYASAMQFYAVPQEEYRAAGMFVVDPARHVQLDREPKAR